MHYWCKWDAAAAAAGTHPGGTTDTYRTQLLLQSTTQNPSWQQMMLNATEHSNGTCLLLQSTTQNLPVQMKAGWQQMLLQLQRTAMILLHSSSQRWNDIAVLLGAEQITARLMLMHWNAIALLLGEQQMNAVQASTGWHQMLLLLQSTVMTLLRQRSRCLCKSFHHCE